MRFLEKDTSSGREYREYWCEQCQKTVTTGGNMALWQALHDANEERRAQRQSAPAPAPQRAWWRFWTR